MQLYSGTLMLRVTPKQLNEEQIVILIIKYPAKLLPDSIF